MNIKANHKGEKGILLLLPSKGEREYMHVLNEREKKEVREGGEKERVRERKRKERKKKRGWK